MTVAGAWKKELRTVAKGALYVPLAQPRAPGAGAARNRRRATRCWPGAASTMPSERKEYMEDYVAEDVARAMLAADPALAAAFRAKLAAERKRLRRAATRASSFLPVGMNRGMSATISTQ
ncbi:hypothetical protein LP419_17505 [Massilia sp. H-1]|nr:hypothetical protein LP419_17505 [Massilia sp. H-1]